MIERKGHEPKLRRWFPSLKDDLSPSLKEDKPHVQELWPFDNRFQCIKYLEGSTSLTTSLVKGDAMNRSQANESMECILYLEDAPARCNISAKSRLSKRCLPQIAQNISYCSRASSDALGSVQYCFSI